MRHTFYCWRFSLFEFKMWNRDWVFSHCVGWKWKSLKAKGSGNIISFELNIIFCSCPVVSVFFLILLEKSYAIFFERQNTKKNDRCLFIYSHPLSLQVDLRSLLFILVWESLNPLANSKTDSKEQNSFSPSTVLPLLYTSVKTGCLE